MEYFVYILFSAGHDKYYIGQTNNLEGRLDRHNKGMENFTAKYLPWTMIWHTSKPDRSSAMILERKLKNLSRQRLVAFIHKYSKGSNADEA
jgi:putative endonuclease